MLRPCGKEADLPAIVSDEEQAPSAKHVIELSVDMLTKTVHDNDRNASAACLLEGILQSVASEDDNELA